MSKYTLGLCMIVKNEEKVIGRCLESVKDLFDEIVIVDTGSTDKTKEIVSKYTDKIYDFKWINDFSAARNYSFSKSTCDFIMWLDADDVVYEKDLIKLKEEKKKLDINIEGYRMEYSYAQDEDDNTTITQKRVRIVRNENLMSNIKGIYPCGDGAGYAGGIMTAAVDGIKVAIAILEDK